MAKQKKISDVQRIENLLVRLEKTVIAFEKMQTHMQDLIEGVKKNGGFLENFTQEQIKILNTPIGKTELSQKAYDACSRMRISKVNGLVKIFRKDFELFSRSGRKPADEIEQFLDKHGLFWGIVID